MPFLLLPGLCIANVQSWHGSSSCSFFILLVDLLVVITDMFGYTGIAQSYNIQLKVTVCASGETVLQAIHTDMVQV